MIAMTSPTHCGALYEQHVARAFEFAECMSKSKYDPMYTYERFKGK